MVSHKGPRSDGRHGARRAPWVWAIAVVALVLALWAVGCSDPVTRYEMLSTFFDDVPVPPSLRVGNIGGDDQGAPTGPRPNQPKEKHEVVFKYHEPYKKRDCFACHDERRGYEAALDGVDSCRKCHESYFQVGPDDWMHGPVAMQDCRLCHESHRSAYDGLLTSAQIDLCQRCHKPQWIDKDPYHSKLEDRTCSRCHDPHSAGNALLLIDARTLERRRQVRKRVDSVHPLYTQDQCAQCHHEAESNRLKDNIDAACISCHEKALVAEGPKLHKAVADGKCLSCHTSHQSPRPSLVRASAEQTCFECHNPQEIQTVKHPNVARVDCLACHTGHRHEREHMLRENIGVPPARAATEKPAETKLLTAQAEGPP